MPRIPLSILDLSPIREGGDAALALRSSLDLAQHAERWGYRRISGWALYDYHTGCAVRGEDGKPTRVMEALALKR